MLKKSFSVILSIITLLLIVPINSFVSLGVSAFDGSGTADDPYKISSAADLIKLSELLNDDASADSYYNKYYIQTADIDLDNVPFTPIGTYTDSNKGKGFYGVYDGNYHNITNLNVSHTRYTGLFGWAYDEAQILNLTVMGNVSASASPTGGIVGELGQGSRIDHCAFIGNVTGIESTGGIAGSIWRKAEITNSYFNGVITNNSESGGQAGGIVGMVNLGSKEDEPVNALIEKCYAVGKITAEKNTACGGIVGKNVTENDKAELKFKWDSYLKSMADGGINSGADPSISKFADGAMMALDGLEMDGENPFYQNNRVDDFNNGYPIFKWQQETRNLTKGDINFDEKVNMADAVLLQKYLLGTGSLSDAKLKLADLDENERIDVFEMVLMRQLLVKLDKLTLPNVIGMSESSALAEFDEIGLQVEIKYETNEKIKKGIVMSQSPKNDQIKANTVVTLLVSKGPKAVEPEKITLNRTSKTLNLAGNSDITLQLEATVSPADVTDKSIIWTSSDTNIATLSEDGLVTAVSNGKATITAKSASGNVTASCDITVVTEWIYGEWGPEIESASPVEASDVCAVEARTRQEIESYNINYYCTVSLNPEWHREFRNYSINGNYSLYGLYVDYGERTTATSYDGAPYLVKTPAELNAVQVIHPGEWSTGSQYGKNCGDIDGYSFDGCIFYICGTNFRDVTYYVYKERTRTPAVFE